MAGFPIFVDLSRGTPLVNGGGDLAAIKARLLLKRAERITFAADQVSGAARVLIESGRAEVIGARPGAEEIKGRPLVISATEDDAEDRRVSDIARSLGVPVNVPDRSELCTFSLPALIDRGLVTVAIGTDGAAPVLATQIRARIEQMLHPRIGALAAVARSFRQRVAETLSEGSRRREFWEHVFGGEAADAVLNGKEEEARRLIEAELSVARNAPPTVGRVILVGAGPGDPELLTLKAVRALKSADVILTDFLIGDGVLDYARREAQIISVGKSKGRHSKTQAEINALILSFARQGQTVVRLKGGDPFLFGRGGEEIDELRASGIACEVIPGVTAATAAAASLQVPLTHRDISRSVTFISGHVAGGGAPDFSHLDFKGLARGRNTIVVYMGVSTAHVFGQALMDAGWSPATPVLAIERATHESERRVATTLDVLSGRASALKLKGPALLICGEVAGLTPDGAVEHVTKDIAMQFGFCAEAGDA